MSSVCVKRMHISQDTEVTGVLHFPDKNRFMSVGWNRRITTFPDQPDVSIIPRLYPSSFTVHGNTVHYPRIATR